MHSPPKFLQKRKEKDGRVIGVKNVQKIEKNVKTSQK